MKARVKATGDIVDATYWHTADDGVKYYEIDKSGYMMMEDELDFDFLFTPDYWKKLKHQYAGMAMQAILSSNVMMEILSRRDSGTMEDEVAMEANDYATALVEKLKLDSNGLE